MLPWFKKPIFRFTWLRWQGVTDVTFRTLCKELGADVMVTRIRLGRRHSSSGSPHPPIHHLYRRTTPCGHPIVWCRWRADGRSRQEKSSTGKKPDFIDLNFGCPVNKVVSRKWRFFSPQGLLSPLRYPRVKSSRPSATRSRVTGKIRIGWDQQSINATEVCHPSSKVVEFKAVAIHGRTRAQSYRGEADWDVIDECARPCHDPDHRKRRHRFGRDSYKKRKADHRRLRCHDRAGRHAKTPGFSPRQNTISHTGELPPTNPPIDERWSFVLRHCRLAVQSDRYGEEKHTMQAMRSRLMTYCKGFPGAKALRKQLCQVTSVADVEAIAANSHLLSDCE